MTAAAILNLKTSNFAGLDLESNGIRRASLKRLAKALGLSETEVIKLLPVSRATVLRLKPVEKFDLPTSEHVIWLARVAESGEKFFENVENFHTWLTSPCLGLGRKKPITFLLTVFGCQEVINVMGRAATGVY